MYFVGADVFQSVVLYQGRQHRITYLFWADFLHSGMGPGRAERENIFGQADVFQTVV